MTLRPLHRGYRPERRPHAAADCPREEALCRRKLGLGIDQHVYALASTTIDLCLSLFPWADFRATKAAVKRHTLLDLRDNIPSFSSTSRTASCPTFTPSICCSPAAGAIYITDCRYVDFTRLYGVVAIA